jgi:hypothetical protein
VFSGEQVEADINGVTVKITKNTETLFYKNCQDCVADCIGHDFNADNDAGNLKFIIGEITKYDPRDEDANTIEAFFESILNSLKNRNNVSYNPI